MVPSPIGKLKVDAPVVSVLKNCPLPVALIIPLLVGVTVMLFVVVRVKLLDPKSTTPPDNVNGVVLPEMETSEPRDNVCPDRFIVNEVSVRGETDVVRLPDIAPLPPMVSPPPVCLNCPEAPNDIAPFNVKPAIWFKIPSVKAKVPPITNVVPP